MDGLQSSLSGIQGAFNNILDNLDTFTEKAFGIAENVYAFRDIGNESTDPIAADSANTTQQPVYTSSLASVFNENKGLVTAGLLGVGAIGIALAMRR